MTDCRLNERQRRFAEEHHGVLESFLSSRGLSMDEYYDVVVFDFLIAVKLYDERECLRKHDFSNIADRHMRSALGNHFGREKRARAGITVLSLDYKFTDSNLTLGDVVADERVNVCDEVCEKLSRTPQGYRLLHTYPNESIARVMALREVV